MRVPVDDLNPGEQFRWLDRPGLQVYDEDFVLRSHDEHGPESEEFVVCFRDDDDGTPGERAVPFGTLVEAVNRVPRPSVWRRMRRYVIRLLIRLNRSRSAVKATRAYEARRDFPAIKRWRESK